MRCWARSIRSLAAVCVPILAATGAGSAELHGYRADLSLQRDRQSRQPLVVLRTFEQNGVARHLVADPDTLDTRVLDSTALEGERVPWAEARSALARTAYGRALADEAGRDLALTDAGLTHLQPTSSGMDLTVDLCPSRRPLDRELFTALIDELGRVERPVPLAIAVTGVWMRQHPLDLDWLKSLASSGTLAVTWINHSFNHHVGAGQPLQTAFLLQPGTDLDLEVLATERALLEHGLTPSIFFRFPGLISDRGLFERILSYGLLPIGSDAWLAKNERPRTGSIVLVHGNGNEPLGVLRFRDLLRRERRLIQDRHWILLDLRESVAETEAPRPHP